MVIIRLALYNIFSILPVLFNYLLYCSYKGFIFIYLFLFVNRFKTLDNNYWCFCSDKYVIIFFLYNSIITIFFTYIVYYIPSINNLYLFSIKDVVGHIVLLIKIIKSIKSKLIPIYRLYAFKKRLRISAISLQIKLIIYLKMLIFGFIYSITFILLPFIEIIFSLNYYIDIFYYHYYFNACLEMFFGLIVGVIFLPIEDKRFYSYPIDLEYDSNNRFLYLKIDKKKEKNYNISNLTKKTLKKEYKKEKLPVLFLNPFPKKNINENYLYIGIIKK